ncbi:MULTISPECIES: galactokinase [unclassified Arthrobacter]|uniref:galactokinase n=1 Tax=unclassified Arthrobacter TaxID=235627 RepID=UPI001492D8F7|nr:MULTISPECIES: galactokinase [unclassified Arthrobacter]MBE0008993.1 galactokinase [Arthrobacter sp. AET 35A]NOJ62877.1 galactokinase [Arthrobacter sp. 147(2020)]
MTGPSHDLATAFTHRFGYEPAGVWSAPGRVNLIGEHTDYNSGFVLPFAINHSTLVAAATRQDRTVRVASTLGEGDEVQVDLDGLHPGSVDGWAAYPVGVLWALEQAGHRLPGFDLLIDSSVPVGAGLSSSAAIECAVAVAANDLVDAGLLASELALVGQRAENEMVGAPTGVMDQTASLRGRAGHAVFLDCRSLESELVPFPLQEEGLTLLVIDTHVSHSHSTGGYADRRKSCERGAELMGVASLRDLSIADLAAAAGILDEETLRRVRHIVTENERVQDTVKVLADKGPAAIGQLLDVSHSSMRDDFEISCDELDLAVDTARANGALGARMTGGGFGGSAIALTPTDDVDRVTTAVTDAFAAAGYVAPSIFAVLPDDGARRLA